MFIAEASKLSDVGGVTALERLQVAFALGQEASIQWCRATDIGCEPSMPVASWAARTTIWSIWGYRTLFATIPHPVELPRVFNTKTAVNQWMEEAGLSRFEVLVMPFPSLTELKAFGEGAQVALPGKLAR